MREFKLDDICFIQSGGTPDRSNLEFYNSPFIPWAKVGDIELGKEVHQTEEFISEGGLKSIGNRVFEKGTLLLALYGSTLGKTAIAGIRLSSNQAILGISSKDEEVLNNSYLKYWFDFNKDRIVFKQKGGAQKNLNADYIKKLTISIPSIKDQKKDVYVLDIIQSIILKREKSIKLLEECVKNTFLEMFLENQKFSSKSKFWTSISDVVQGSTYGTSKKANNQKKGIPIIRMNNITYNGELDLSDLKWIEYNNSEKKRFELNNGDVLFNRTNSKELVGKTAVWDKGKGYTFAGYLVKIVLNKNKIKPSYFVSYLNSEFGKKILFNKGKSSGSQVNFSPPLLKTQKILVPPIALQLQYEQIYSRIKLQKQSLEKSLTLLRELNRMIIYEIFDMEKQRKRDEIDELIEDDIKLEIFLNTINSSDFQNEELYSLEVEKLIKILDRTKQRNLEDLKFKKGIIQRLEDKKVILESNREYKNRLIDEAAST